MMSKFSIWWIRNQYAITWFIIGWMTSLFLAALERGNWALAALAAAIAGANYWFGRSQSNHGQSG